ncbi:MAG: Thioredoxin, partial [uncultured Rubrobacteraceae bacterium]
GGKRRYRRELRERGPEGRQAGHRGLLGALVRAVPQGLPDPRRDEREPRGRALRQGQRGRQPRDRHELQHHEHPHDHPLRGRRDPEAGRRRPAEEPARGAARLV